MKDTNGALSGAKTMWTWRTHDCSPTKGNVLWSYFINVLYYREELDVKATTMTVVISWTVVVISSWTVVIFSYSPVEPG